MWRHLVESIARRGRHRWNVVERIVAGLPRTTGSIARVVTLAANSQGGTLKDAFVATALGALQRYHDALGESCAEIRMHMPVSVRSDHTANRSDQSIRPDAPDSPAR